jgi:hypothetical protein
MVPVRFIHFEEKAMKKLLCTLPALLFLTGMAAAAQPMTLNEAQMDTVTAAGEGGGEATVVAEAIGLLMVDTFARTGTTVNAIDNSASAEANGSATAASGPFEAVARVTSKATAFIVPYSN